MVGSVYVWQFGSFGKSKDYYLSCTGKEITCKEFGGFFGQGKKDLFFFSLVLKRYRGGEVGKGGIWWREFPFLAGYSNVNNPQPFLS